MPSPKKDPIKERDNYSWRWIASISVVLNIAFNYIYNNNPLSNQTIGEVSDEYYNYFTPASYAFSIWGLIFLSLLIYSVVQLLPSQRNVKIYNRLTGPLILTSWLTIAWVVLFSYEFLGTSVFVIIGMMYSGILLFSRSKDWVLRRRENKWLPIPFGLYIGWLTVATISNFAVLFTSLGWRGGVIGEANWAVIMLALSLLLALLISYKFKDIVYPLVIVWGVLAIYFEHREDSGAVAYFALAVAILIFLWVVGFSIYLIQNKSLKSFQTHDS